jgi:hypothetical protein
MDYEIAKEFIAKSDLANQENPAWSKYAEKLARIAEQEDKGKVDPFGTVLDVTLATEDYYTERDLNVPARIATRFNLKPLLGSILSAPVIEGLTEVGIVPPDSPEE